MPNNIQCSIFNSIKKMKKTYMIPTMKVVKIQSACILAGSNMQVQGDYDEKTVTVGARRAHFSDWEEEE